MAQRAVLYETDNGNKHEMLPGVNKKGAAVNTPLKRNTKKAPFCQPRIAVLRCKAISRDARFLYAILRSFARSSDSCFPSIATLSEICGAHRSSVCRWLSELEAARIITRSARKDGSFQRSNLYLLDDDHFSRFLAKTMSQKETSSMSQKETTNEMHIKKKPVLPFKPQKPSENIIPIHKSS